MIVVGFHLGHDPNIGIVDNGNLYHLELERISRIKHGFNYNQQDFNLKEILKKYYNLSIEDIDFFVFPVDVVWHSSRFHGEGGDGKVFELFTNHSISNIIDKIQRAMPIFTNLKIEKFLYGKDIYFIRHHLSHAAYSFFTSPFEKSKILSYDGIGWFDTPTIIADGVENKIINVVNYPKFYLGFFYNHLTNFLFEYTFNKPVTGFWEGKTMGFSSYGDPIYLENIKKILYIENDPLSSLDLESFFYRLQNVNIQYTADNQKFVKMMEEVLNIKTKKDIFIESANIIASFQKYFELLVEEIVKSLNIDKLCISGGSGLNGLINAKIAKLTDVYIPPATSDCGLGLGSALYGYYHIANNKRKFYDNVAYLGLEYEVPKVGEKMPYEKIYKLVAKALTEQKLVAWYQGRSESGPRALGNRSILADPRDPSMQVIINKRIKHREWFRPFAPAILYEYKSEYFEDGIEDKYMLKIAKVKPEKLSLFPAAIHVDNTARLQTVKKEDNLHFYNVIKEFYNLTGLPIILNTSFNRKGEPIINTPEEALDMFKKTDIDILVLKNRVIKK